MAAVPVPQEPKSPTAAQPVQEGGQEAGKGMADQLTQVASDVLRNLSNMIAVFDKVGDKMGVNPQAVEALKGVADQYVQVMQEILGGEADQAEDTKEVGNAKGPVDMMGGPNGKPM